MAPAPVRVAVRPEFWVEAPHPFITRARVLTTVLGEIPDQDAALCELRPVLKPGGRLVVGELFGDPHWVRPSRLRERARAAGLHLDRQDGRLAYFARFQTPHDEVTV